MSGWELYGLGAAVVPRRRLGFRRLGSGGSDSGFKRRPKRTTRTRRGMIGGGTAPYEARLEAALNEGFSASRGSEKLTASIS